MMVEFLESMTHIKGQAPFKRFIIMRDGLTETEIGTVANREIADIKAAVEEVYKKYGVNYTPTFTFLVAQKGSSIRFATSDPEDSCTRHYCGSDGGEGEEFLHDISYFSSWDAQTNKLPRCSG